MKEIDYNTLFEMLSLVIRVEKLEITNRNILVTGYCTADARWYGYRVEIGTIRSEIDKNTPGINDPVELAKHLGQQYIRYFFEKWIDKFRVDEAEAEAKRNQEKLRKNKRR